VNAKKDVNLYLRLLKRSNGICGSLLIFDRCKNMYVKKSDRIIDPKKLMESQPHSSALESEKTNKPTAKTASVESMKSIFRRVFLPGTSAFSQERKAAKRAIGICEKYPKRHENELISRVMIIGPATPDAPTKTPTRAKAIFSEPGVAFATRIAAARGEMIASDTAVKPRNAIRDHKFGERAQHRLVKAKKSIPHL